MNKAGLTILGLIALSSCSNIHPHTNDTIISDTVPYDYVLDDVANVKEYVDSIHMLSRFLVEQEDYLLFDDKAEWEAYETAMSYSKNAFIAHDYYSSLDLALAQFEIEFLEQRLISLVDLCGYLKGTPVSDSRHNAVTNSMIDNAYGLFLDAVKHCTIYEDYEDSVIVKMNNALNEEQKAWKRWINEREIVASRLNGEAKKNLY